MESSPLSILTPANPSALAPARRDDDVASFLDALSIAGREAHANEALADRARTAAERFVAMTLVQPILKQVRETNHAAPPFAPTQAEKQFGALMDARIAQDVVKAAHFPLVDRLARDLLSRSLGAGSSRAPETDA